VDAVDRGEAATIPVLLSTIGEPVNTGSVDACERTTLMLAEDEPALRRLVVRILDEQGYAVLHAGNGLEAIATAERYPGEIHLLLTDVVMPGLSGPELAQQLRARRPGVKVLFVSGNSDSRVGNRGGEQFKVNMLVKPFTPEQLINRVAELTRGSSCRVAAGDGSANAPQETYS
jgi:two-component system cell cycle sensor histidine kinase/response regulator CckA